MSHFVRAGCHDLTPRPSCSASPTVPRMKWRMRLPGSDVEQSERCPGVRRRRPAERLRFWAGRKAACRRWAASPQLLLHGRHHSRRHLAEMLTAIAPGDPSMGCAAPMSFRRGRQPPSSCDAEAWRLGTERTPSARIPGTVGGFGGVDHGRARGRHSRRSTRCARPVLVSRNWSASNRLKAA